MKTNSPLEMGTTFRAGALSSLLALASAGISLGQEPLELENLEIFRPQDEPWLVTFNAEIDQQYIVYSSIDLECWGYAGACFELDLGDYQFVDQALLPPSKQFFIFETFDPEVTLPPQLEQLRMDWETNSLPSGWSKMPKKPEIVRGFLKIRLRNCRKISGSSSSKLRMCWIVG